MKTRRSAFLILAIALLPSTASANAGTPLMWATMLHLVFGNAIIGLIEGILLSRILKCPARRSIPILIVANYVSAWAGGFLLTGFFIPFPDITIENIRFWFCAFVGIAFLVTLLIELPFFWLVLRSQGKMLLRAAKATVLVNTISYGLLFAWYWMASGTSMMTRLQVVSPGDFIHGNDYALYFISTDGTQILQTDLNGQHRSVLREVVATHRNDRLFSRPNSQTGCDLFVRLDSDKREDEREELIAVNFSEHAPIDWRISDGRSEETQGTWFKFGKVPSIALKSDWEFETGFWPIEGIRCKNKNNMALVRFSMETPFAAWIVRNATHLEGDTVVFQLGDNQICILDPASRRIALIARGKGPIVAKATTSTKKSPQGQTARASNLSSLAGEWYFAPPQTANGVLLKMGADRIDGFWLDPGNIESRAGISPAFSCRISGISTDHLTLQPDGPQPSGGIAVDGEREFELKTTDDGQRLLWLDLGGQSHSKEAGLWWFRRIPEKAGP